MPLKGIYKERATSSGRIIGYPGIHVETSARVQARIRGRQEAEGRRTRWASGESTPIDLGLKGIV